MFNSFRKDLKELADEDLMELVREGDVSLPKSLHGISAVLVHPGAAGGHAGADPHSGDHGRAQLAQDSTQGRLDRGLPELKAELEQPMRQYALPGRHDLAHLAVEQPERESRDRQHRGPV